MEKRKTTIYLIAGILLGLFIVPPVLTFVFGEKNPMALVFSGIVILLVIIWPVKKPK